MARGQVPLSRPARAFAGLLGAVVYWAAMESAVEKMTAGRELLLATLNQERSPIEA